MAQTPVKAVAAINTQELKFCLHDFPQVLPWTLQYRDWKNVHFVHKKYTLKVTKL